MRPVLAAALLAALSSRTAFAQEITLPEVVQLALVRNERARLADLGVVTADAAVTRARAGFLPTVTISGNETLRPQSLEQNGRTVVRSNGATSSITVSQPIVSVTAFPLYASAKHGFEAARFTTQDQRRQLCFDAARTFFGVIAQERVQTAATQRLERAEANLNDTRARAVAQIASSNDVTRSEVDRATAAVAVSVAQGGVEQARITLGYITDSPVKGTVRAPENALVPGNLDIATLANQALSHRPDLAAARETAAAAAASADEPGLRFVPTLGASAQARLADQTIAADRYYDTTLTLNLSWTLWDAGVRGADAQSRQAAANVAELTMRALKRKVEADVKSAVAALVAARQAAEAAGQAVEAARRSAEETSVLYKQGLARAIELVDANLSRYDAEVSLAGAQLSLRQAELDLRAALGLFPIDGVQ